MRHVLDAQTDLRDATFSIDVEWAGSVVHAIRIGAQKQAICSLGLSSYQFQICLAISGIAFTSSE